MSHFSPLLDDARAITMTVQRSWRVGRVIWLAISALLCVSLGICYGFRFDVVAAITIFPCWIWPLPGIFLLTLALHRRAPQTHKRLIAAVGLLWLTFFLIFVEEAHSLSREVLASFSSPSTKSTLRVVTLNGAGGSSIAAEEVARFDPDLVLWQEAPNRKECERLARKIFGAKANVFVGLDTAIAAPGIIEPKTLPREMSRFCSQAQVTLESGRAIEVFSVHLLTPPFRVDLWNLDCWKAQREQRETQRAQLQAVANRIAELPDETPVILGGDFNAPQNDAIFRLLQPRLRDSFRGAGLGWGDTITNDTPFLRIDQIWISRHFDASAVRAHRTNNSDHRLVVCDLN